MIFVNSKYKSTFHIIEGVNLLGVVLMAWKDRKTWKFIGPDDPGPYSPGRLWRFGWVVRWEDCVVKAEEIGRLEYFPTLHDLHKKYDFENFPGPRNVLRLTRRHKDFVEGADAKA